MCGIAGIITYDGSPPDAAPLEAMRRALAHRGPDGGDVRIDGRIGLVHLRLAIIDLATGDQPLFGPDGAALVGNGEIYNYIELNADLGPDPPRKTKADFEPYLHYVARADGETGAGAAVAALGRLRGMFTLAWADSKGEQLALARDPFGIKPLYLADTGVSLLFASEPRALFASGLVSADLDGSALRTLAELGHTADGVWRGVDRLPPWHAAAVSDAAPAVASYGALAVTPAKETDMADAVAAFDRRFEESVTLHQRSDVPYGLFLSGGIDSAAILTMMARLNERPVRSFTCGFENSRGSTPVADERPAARRVADAMGADHTELSFTEDDFHALLPQVAWCLDDPTVDYAVLPTWKLGQAARQAGLKVVLSGEGGDEVFAGYGRYRYLMKPWWRGGRKPRVRGRLTRMGLAGDDAWRAVAASAHACTSAATNRLEAAQRADMRHWLTDDLLLKLDRCLMAHGVEGRVPFLDPPLVAWGLGLKPELKVTGGLGKAVVRHWLAQHCPAADAFSRKKGFTVPVGHWIGRAGDSLAARVADSALVRQLAAPEDVQRVFANAAETHAGMAAWTLLFLAVWGRVHLDGADQRQGTADILM